MPLSVINERLVIKDGVIACRDGTPLAEYLKQFFQEGDSVNVLHHDELLRLNREAALWDARAC